MKTNRDCSAGFQTCCVADFQVGRVLERRTRGGFGNPRHSRLGSLRSVRTLRYVGNRRYEELCQALLQRQSSGRAQRAAVTGLFLI